MIFTFNERVTKRQQSVIWLTI